MSVYLFAPISGIGRGV
jgi:hypothetical protein